MPGEEPNLPNCDLARTLAEPFGQLLAQAVDTWVARDDRIIEIRLTRPFPLLLDAMALPDASAWIMPEHLAQTDPNTALKEMMGSGPYRFIADEYNSGNRIVYEKFDAHVLRSERHRIGPRVGRSRISGVLSGMSFPTRPPPPPR